MLASSEDITPEVFQILPQISLGGFFSAPSRHDGRTDVPRVLGVLLLCDATLLGKLFLGLDSCLQLWVQTAGQTAGSFF